MAPKKSLEGLLERNRVGLFRQTLDGRLVDCNEAFARILGYDSSHELLQTGRIDYVNASDFHSLVAAIRDLDVLGEVELSLRRRNGNAIWVVQNLSFDSDEQVIEGACFELSVQHRPSERSLYQATHDPLTGAPNRMLFADRLTVALAHARRRNQHVAVCFLDLDHFDLINVTFGRNAADKVLQVVADRLSEAVRTEDTVARFGSDEFALVLSGITDEPAVAGVATRLLDTISEPIRVNGHEIFVHASMGIAVGPENGTDPDTLLRQADAAMFRAKEKGRNNFQFFQPDANSRTFERAAVISGLQRALQNDELVLHYLPQINVLTGRVDTIEALLRWQHPELGLVQPGEFLPAAEHGNLIHRIGEWVVRTAARQIHKWNDLGFKVPRVAINLSWKEFASANLSATLERLIGEEGIDPDSIELEISEAILQGTRPLAALHELKSIGVRLALDNYGSSRSSLLDLTRFPFDTVKIDRSFVRNLNQPDEAAVIQAVITLARSLGLRVVAEGVETRDQLTFLRERNCTEMSGFFFGQPAAAPGMEELLRMQH